MNPPTIWRQIWGCSAEALEAFELLFDFGEAGTHLLELPRDGKREREGEDFRVHEVRVERASLDEAGGLAQEGVDRRLVRGRESVQLGRGPVRGRLSVQSDHAGRALPPVRGQTRLSKIGNARVRKALYLPALTALRFDPRIKRMGKRLRERGKNEMVILGAAMRKLVHQAYGVLITGRPFSPAHAITA